MTEKTNFPKMGDKLNCQIQITGHYLVDDNLVYTIIPIQIKQNIKIKKINRIVIERVDFDKIELLRSGQKAKIAMEFKRVDKTNQSLGGKFTSFIGFNDKQKDNISLEKDENDSFGYVLKLTAPTAEEFKKITERVVSQETSATARTSTPPPVIASSRVGGDNTGKVRADSSDIRTSTSAVGTSVSGEVGGDSANKANLNPDNKEDAGKILGVDKNTSHQEFFRVFAGLV